MSERGHNRVVRAMLDAGADPNVKGAFDENPRSWAARRGNTDIAKMLRVDPANSPDAMLATDGTWVVKARAFPFQPLKESGFPHGRDQWISSAATAWASMALSLALDGSNAAVAAR